MLSGLMIIAKHMLIIMNSGFLLVAAHLRICDSLFKPVWTSFCATMVQIKQVVSLLKWVTASSECVLTGTRRYFYYFVH